MAKTLQLKKEHNDYNPIKVTSNTREKSLTITQHS